MDYGGEEMISKQLSKYRQRGVLSIEAAVVSSLVALALVGIGGWVKYDADFKSDRAAADNLNLVLQGAQTLRCRFFRGIPSRLASSPIGGYSHGFKL
jgi:hypothetical protein